MRVPVFMGVLITTVLLHGCASAPATTPVNLFGQDGKPHFHAYLACISNTVNCAIAGRDFDRWADERHVALEAADPTDEAFAVGTPSPKNEQVLPYRLALRFEPDLSVPDNTMGGAALRPVISYKGTARVFDSASGQLLKTYAFKDKQVIDQTSGSANPYIDAAVANFIGRLDPDYGKLAAR